MKLYKSLWLCGALGLVSGALADPINFYAVTFGGYGDSTTGGFNSTAGMYSSVSGAGPLHAMGQDSTTVYSDPVGGDMHYTGFAQARTDYVNLGAEGSLTLTNAHPIAGQPSGQIYTASAFAGYKTGFTIVGPSLVQGDIFNQAFTFQIDGSVYSDNSYANPYSFLYVHVGDDAPEGTYAHGNQTFTTVTHHFMPNVSNNFQVEMSAGADIDVDHLSGQTVTSAALFWNTVKLTNVAITDQSGHAINDFALLDSNTGKKIYASGSLAPEPASMAALGLGLFALIKRRRSTR